MAFAPPDPKRVEADRQRVAQRRLDDIRALEEKRRIAREIRACYFPGKTLVNGVEAEGHSPKQIRHAGEMIRNHNDGALRVEMAENMGLDGVCWQNIGRSRGGKRKGNLYRCLVQL